MPFSVLFLPVKKRLHKKGESLLKRLLDMSLDRTLLDLVGKGTFSDVYLDRRVLEGEETVVALKWIDKLFVESLQCVDQIKTEKHILEEIGGLHPCISPLIEVINQPEHIIFVLPFIGFVPLSLFSIIQAACRRVIVDWSTVCNSLCFYLDKNRLCALPIFLVICTEAENFGTSFAPMRTKACRMKRFAL